jgi:hypothetical protein
MYKDAKSRADGGQQMCKELEEQWQMYKEIEEQQMCKEIEIAKSMFA